MQPDDVIEVNNIKKKFKVYFDKGNSLKEKVIFKNRNKYEERWVLKGISFSVKKGEAIGLIGKNGCGKSTTLKMLSRIMYPTEGTIEIKGRVSSLIELGAGFHPDMSGRENIFTNASIFGLTHDEIERRLDDIIHFSELEEYIDNPVRTYSSGMYMRLAFAVAINVDADVLLIDEILAVGDVSFQTKCFEKLKEIKAKGTTIVIVSHVMNQIEQICDRAIWLEEGLIREEGSPKEIGQKYLEVMEERRLAKIEKDYKEHREKVENNENIVEEIQKSGKQLYQQEEMPERDTQYDGELLVFAASSAVRKGNQKIRFVDVALYNSKGEETILFQPGEKVVISMKYKADLIGQKMNCVVGITREDGVYCFGTSALAGRSDEMISKEEGEIRLVFEENNLQPGKYLLDVGIQDLEENVYDYIYNVQEIRVHDKDSTQIGIVNMPKHWEF